MNVTSHTSHLCEGTMDRQIHVANSPYVTGRVGAGTLRNTVLNFVQFSALS